MKSSKRTKQVLWSAVTAVGVVGVAGHAWGQLTTNPYNFNANYASEVETTGPYNSGSSGPSYVDVNGAGEKYANYSVLQFSTAGGQFANTLATAVNPNFTLELTDNDYTGEYSAGPTTLSYFLVDDATTDISTDGSSPLIYEPSGVFGGGLAAPGATGGFPAADHIYYLGSQVWQGAGTGALNTMNLSVDNATMNSAGAQNTTAADNYLLSEVQNSQPIRLLITSSSTASNYVAYDGWSSGNAPQLTLTVTANTPQANNSTIALTSTVGLPGGSTVNNVNNINLGRVIESYASYTNTSTNIPGGGVTLTVQNPATSTGGALILAAPNNGLDGSTAPATAIAPGATGTITVGFNSADTSGYEAGYEATGNITFTDANNTGSTITASAYALVVDQRAITSGGTGNGTSPAANNVGKILVGGTGSNPNITLSTTNSNSNLQAGQYGPNYVTTETLALGATSDPYVVDDPFTKAPVATLNATANNAFVFNSTTNDTNGVTATVAVTVSGVYGDDHAEVNGTSTEYVEGDYTSFSKSYGLTNDGTTAGEDDYADVYLQWQGYQAAMVTPSGGTNLVGNTVTLTNAASNDNIYNGVSQGLRAAGWVTGINPNQTWSGGGGWSLTGFTADTNSLSASTTNGTVIAGSTTGGVDGAGDTHSYSQSATVAFAPTSQMINGVYGGTISVALETEHDIQGTVVNDLTPAVFTVAGATVSQPSGTGAGAYTLNGGTLTAASTTLTGSFTQTGGSSNFPSLAIASTGSVGFSGGSMTVGSLAISGSGKMVLATNATSGSQSANPPNTAPTSNVNIATLAITGSGLLDIANNHIIIDYGSGPDPIGTIASLIKSGAYGSGTTVTWTGTGITSSAAAANAGSYGIGYADANDTNNPAGLSSGQIEIMYTLLGDANLDGKVNGIDFNLLASSFNQAVTNGWDEGDFNYDGKVNGIDFNLLAANFNQAASQSADASDLAALESFAAANGISLTSVPEPASATLMVVAGLGILRRRRRSSQ